MRGGIVMDELERELNEGGKTIDFRPPPDPGRPVPVRYEPKEYTTEDMMAEYQEKKLKGKLLTTKKEVLEKRLKDLKQQELENNLK